MSLRCNNCGKDLGSYPEEAVEEKELEEVIGHKQQDEPPFVSKKDYYCRPECFAEEVVE